MRKFNYNFFDGYKEIKASILLCNILKDIDNDHLSREVASKLHKYHDKLSVINNVKKYKRYFLDIIFIETKKSINLNNYPLNVKTHLLNLITALYRKKLINLWIK